MTAFRHDDLPLDDMLTDKDPLRRVLGRLIATGFPGIIEKFVRSELQRGTMDEALLAAFASISSSMFLSILVRHPLTPERLEEQIEEIHDHISVLIRRHFDQAQKIIIKDAADALLRKMEGGA